MITLPNGLVTTRIVAVASWVAHTPDWQRAQFEHCAIATIVLL